MKDGVEGKGKPQLLDPGGHLQLALEGSCARDPIGRGCRHVLDGDLHVVEAEIAQTLQAVARRGMPLVMRLV